MWSAARAGHDELAPSSSGRDVAWLRQELASSKEYLQSIVDQREASTQELRAAHEEVLSSNEELQSTNEELETTKEELQSANEELTTVNEQFQTRNRELDALTDDLSNFISSADLPMVTVGRDLCIRRLTPAAQTAFNLLPTDVGRSIEHIKSSLVVDGIGTVIEAVIATVQPWQREVRDHEGCWWVLRVQPYRTADHRIDGATIVAVDIDLIKRSHELVEARDYALADRPDGPRAAGGARRRLPRRAGQRGVLRAVRRDGRGGRGQGAVGDRRRQLERRRTPAPAGRGVRGQSSRSTASRSTQAMPGQGPAGCWC